jgi:hypothetical protein
MDQKPSTSGSQRPGDLILNRYMPNATEEEREAARENLREYATVVVGIAKRLVREEAEHAREILEELKLMIEFESP